MGIFVTVIGIFAVVIGLIGLVSPHKLTGIATSLESTMRFRLAIGVRLLIGVAFFFMAPYSSFPVVVEAVAVLSIVAAFIILISGQKRLDAVIEWWASCSPNVVRLSAGFAVVVGVVLACSGI